MTGRHGAPTDGAVSVEPLREQRLAETFVELADTLVANFDLVEFLYTLVERCVELIDVSAVGLMFGDDRGRLRVAASSGEGTRLLELFQLQNDEGPCLECYRTGRPVAEPELAQASARWPLFAPEAVRYGFRTVHALPMRLREQTVGSLNLFHVNPGALSDSATRIAQSLVDVATIGLIQVAAVGHRQILASQLQIALDSRIVIEQAKGILAEQRGLTPTAALALLRRHARTHNERLTAVAHAITDHGPSTVGLPAIDAARTTDG